MPGISGAPTSRSWLTSVAFHLLAMLLLLLIPTGALLPSPHPKELDVVFYKARPPVKVPVSAVLPPAPRAAAAPGPILADRNGSPAPAAVPKPGRPPGPDAPGPPELPPGPESSAPADAKAKVGSVGILAFKDKFASLSRDKVAPRLGADARYSAADDVGKASSRSALTTNAPGSSGGINVASLNRTVGGGGGGGGGGTGLGGSGGGLGVGGGGRGVGTGRATSPIASIGGDDRPKARGGPGNSRSDEEIQIVFDRHKASFYRLYSRELRNNPSLKGQMVLRLTIEPDGSVSMCVLQSTDMNAPDLATQVVSRVRTINFGAKDVQALTIVYPIDFLPAA